MGSRAYNPISLMTPRGVRLGARPGPPGQENLILFTALKDVVGRQYPSSRVPGVRQAPPCLALA